MLPRVGRPSKPLGGYNSKPDTEPEDVSEVQIMLRTIQGWGIAVKAVEDGYSEAYRDGIRLYRWKTLEELIAQMEIPNSKPESGVPGITWAKNSWNVGNYDPGSQKQIYLGRFAFEELDLAKQVLDKAKHSPSAEWPALRDKYQNLRQKKTETEFTAKDTVLTKSALLDAVGARAIAMIHESFISIIYILDDPSFNEFGSAMSALANEKQLLIPHERAQEIIEQLQTFYAKHTPEEIERFNAVRRKDLPQGYVYLMQDEQTKLYKIGATTIGVMRRKAEIERYYRTTLRVIHSFQGGESPFNTEKAAHKKYHQYHIKGEWFRLPDSAVEEFKRLTGPVDLSPKEGKRDVSSY